MEEVLLSRTSPILRYQAIEDDDRPSSLFDCIDSENQMIPHKYAEFLEKEEELEAIEQEIRALMVNEKASTAAAKEPAPKKARSRRRHKSLKPFWIDDDGKIVHLHPQQTYWYLIYVKFAVQNLACPKFKKKFRRRFRMPYEEYDKLLTRVQSDSLFSRWKGADCTGQKASPLELLLLGALRYLGRGLTFDDLEEYTAISEETHRQFFHVFIEWGSTKLFPIYVKMPTTAAEYDSAEYNTGGLTGAGFSTDATNVIMWRCPQSQKQANMGFKQSHPARTYNLSCNHRRKILYTTTGHPSRWNDKTLAHVDTFLSGVHEGSLLQDCEFFLYSKSPTDPNKIQETKYCGAWGLVDNGYHKWACTQAPSKVNVLRREERLSEWIESFRKDSECVFGILKGRFRVLKTGIRLEGTEAADKIWMTCCALQPLSSVEWGDVIGQNLCHCVRRCSSTVGSPFTRYAVLEERVPSTECCR